MRIERALDSLGSFFNFLLSNLLTEVVWQADRPRSVTGRNSALESVPTNAESEDPGHRDIISIIDYVKSNGQMLIT
jgi:hypothetical protein